MCVRQERCWMKQQKNEIRIIFFDIDGTLIDFDKKEISAKTRETLKRLREKNILIAIATGRAPLTLPKFEGVEFDVFLTFNGSYCYNKKEIIFSKSIPAEDVKKIIENAAELNRPVSIATQKRIVANGKDTDLVEYYDLAKLKIEVADDFDETAKDMVYQIMLGSRKEEYPLLMKDVKNAKITAWWDRAVDIIPSDAGKGVGVDKILEYYHLDRSQALAFGDGCNDIEMLQTVGLGVAMGNASEEVKKAADIVCGYVAGDGIYHFCVSHGLI